MLQELERIVKNNHAHIKEKMKAYTDLGQSKKLAEILPVESADMFWKNGVSDRYIQCFTPFVGTGTNVDYDYDVPCWSTAALLDIIRNNGRYELQMYEGGYYFEFNLGVSKFMTETYLNSVDACYEMVMKLHELKML